METKKRLAGSQAAEWVQNGMVVGLGSGSTARFATLRIAERLRLGDLADIVGIPTSEATAALAQREGIPLGTLESHPHVDLTIDGADEVAPNLDLIKGLGGALLREKIVAYASTRQIIVVDDTKLVPCLGVKAPLPIEIVRFGYKATSGAVEQTGTRPVLRCQSGIPFVTDEGHFILDCVYEGGIRAPRDLSAMLQAIPGVVEHGLFLGTALRVVVAGQDGVLVLER